MTVPLSPDSTRRRHAARFGALLTETLAERGVSRRGLARALGTSPGLLWQWSAGNNLPRLETAQRVADALGEPRLAAIVREARTVTCAACRATMVVEGGRPRRWCSDACKVVGNAMRSGVPSRERAVVAERRLALYRDAVAAMCQGCEPEGLCRDASCALRPVSPLPLAKAPRGPSDVPPDPPRVMTDAMREAIVSANRERWARPGAREAMAEAERARVAAMTDEARAEHARRISEGRRRQLARGRVA